jgi:putative spermidine/putrescine transport system ATP-binding protein
MVFQNYALFPHMSVRRNVGFGLAMQGKGRAEIARRVDAALALVRLQAQAEKLPGQLSGGQQQRVAIARATVIEPPLVLMDEPLSNLDAKLRLEMRAEIRRIHDLVGSTTIYVTHDQDEALSLADRVVVLREGRVRQIGTPEELYARPLHPDVAEFMGYRNIVPSRAAPTGNGASQVMIGDAALLGTPVDAREGEVVVAFRPDDLTPRADGPIAATVTAAEYRGRDFFGKAATSEGTELYFRSESKVAPGENVRLGVDPGRLLIYADGGL